MDVYKYFKRFLIMTTIFTQDEIIKIIEHSLNKMYVTEEFILKNDINERCLVTVFRDYLLKEESFNGYSVDTEYNRKGDATKNMLVLFNKYKENLQDSMPLTLTQYNALCKNGWLNKLINPDLIIHERGEQKNLIVFEFKKSTSTCDTRFDDIKLKYFKNSYGYKFAFFIQFSTGENFARSKVKINSI